MDVLVVGAGPAGSVLATLLARSGVNVAVVDRATFPRTKPCGETINPGAVAALDRLGLLDALRRRRPAIIRGWYLSADGHAARAAYGPTTRNGLGLARLDLDEALVTAAREAGAWVVEGTCVRELSRDNGMWTARLVPGRTGPDRTVLARVLVGADGLRSIVARRLGLVARRPQRKKLSLTCHVRGVVAEPAYGVMTVTERGTVGLAPIGEDDLWNATVVVSSRMARRRVASEPESVYREILMTAPVGWTNGGPVIARGPFASGPFCHPTRRTVVDGAILVGDAAGYYDPFTGQGVHQAVRSAELAAAVIERALASDRVGARYLAPYHDRLLREMRSVRLFQHGVDRVFASHWSRGVALRALRRAPRYAGRVVRVAGDAGSPWALARLDDVVFAKGRNGR